MNRKIRAAIFVSGSGSNMESIAYCVQRGELPCEIALIVCDQLKAYALERARNLKLESFVLEKTQFKTRKEFDAEISKELKKRDIEVIFLAGYMRILSPEFVRAWQGRIINVHPSLLPKYPGTHSIKEAFDAKEKETGVTIHYVDEGVDTGPVILQKKVPISPNDTLESLEARIHETEHELYPKAIKLALQKILM